VKHGGADDSDGLFATTSDIASSDNDRPPIMMKEYKVTCASLVMFLSCFIVIFIGDPFFVVEPGTIGVVVTMGKVEAFEPGMHTKIPFVARVLEFTAKTQKLEETNTTPTKEGLTVKLDTAV